MTRIVTFRKQSSILQRTLALGNASQFAAERSVILPITGAFFTDSFDPHGDLSHTEGGAGWLSGTGDTAVASDHSRSGSYALRFAWPAEPSHANAERRFSLGADYDPIWLRYWIYFPDGTEGLGTQAYVCDHDARVGSDNNKFFRVWSITYDDHKVGASIWPSQQGSGYFGQLVPDYKPNGTGSMTPYYAAGYHLPNSLRGRWVEVRLKAKSATPANNDGQVKIWLDGVLRVNAVTFPNYRTAGDNYFHYGYFMGAPNSGFTNQQRLWIDDVEFIGTDPGWEA